MSEGEKRIKPVHRMLDMDLWFNNRNRITHIVGGQKANSPNK